MVPATSGLWCFISTVASLNATSTGTSVTTIRLRGRSPLPLNGLDSGLAYRHIINLFIIIICGSTHSGQGRVIVCSAREWRLQVAEKGSSNGKTSFANPRVWVGVRMCNRSTVHTKRDTGIRKTIQSLAASNIFRMAGSWLGIFAFLLSLVFLVVPERLSTHLCRHLLRCHSAMVPGHTCFRPASNEWTGHVFSLHYFPT